MDELTETFQELLQIMITKKGYGAERTVDAVKIQI